MTGLSFSPFNQNTDQNYRQGSVSPVQDAIKILSLRMPTMVGPHAPSGVLAGGPTRGGMDANNAMMANWLRMLFSGQLGAGGPGGPGMPGGSLPSGWGSTPPMPGVSFMSGRSGVPSWAEPGPPPDPGNGQPWIGPGPQIDPNPGGINAGGGDSPWRDWFGGESRIGW